ncbi:hypothetical protein ACLB2K_005716 [Fragaria x ananassa]
MRSRNRDRVAVLLLQHRIKLQWRPNPTESLNDVDQTKESKSEEAEKNTKEADHDAEGWQLVQHQTRKKKSPRNGNHPQTQENQGAIVNNQVDVEEGIKQIQEVARGMNGSQGVKPKKPNMNGSARRRLQKNKAGAGQDQQVQATKEAAAADTTDTHPFKKKKKKFTVTYTLEEFEKMKKNGHSNKSDEQPHQSAESAEKDNSFKGRYAEKDNIFKGRYAEKDNSFKGRRKQKGGNRFNGDVEDVSPATVEKVEEILFTLVPAEFPVLGKAL